MMAIYWEVHVIHTYREDNKVADRFANRVLKQTVGRINLTSPALAGHLIFKDKTGMVATRRITRSFS